MLPYWYYTYVKKDEKTGSTAAKEEAPKAEQVDPDQGTFDTIRKTIPQIGEKIAQSITGGPEASQIPPVAVPAVPSASAVPAAPAVPSAPAISAAPTTPEAGRRPGAMKEFPPKGTIEKNLDIFYEMTSDILAQSKSFLADKFETARNNAGSVETPSGSASAILPGTSKAKPSAPKADLSDNFIIQFLNKTALYFSKAAESAKPPEIKVKKEAIYDSLNKTEKEINQALAKTRKMIAEALDDVGGGDMAEFVTGKQEAAIGAPVIEKPVIEKPVIETPVMVAPVIEKPVMVAPVIEKPVVVAPIVEAPVVEQVKEVNTAIPPLPVLPDPSFEIIEINKKIYEELLFIKDQLTKSNEPSEAVEDLIPVPKNQSLTLIREIEQEFDIYRDSPFRYLGFANEFGEASKSFIPLLAYRATYAITTMYILADICSKAKNAKQRHISRSSAATDALMWQSFATVLIPGVTINRIVWYAGKYVGPTHSVYVRLIPSLVGLLSIPIIVRPIDKLVTFVMNKTVRRNLSTNF